MSINREYRVVVANYAERHFAKGFSKKYPGKWDMTMRTICFMLARVDGLRETDKAEIIHSCGRKHIIKGDFAVIGMKDSPKASGNRYIAFVDDEALVCEILLIYAKSDKV